jgi:hypothetical protein
MSDWRPLHFSAALHVLKWLAMRGLMIPAASLLFASASFAAQPSALADVAAGIWEISGAPGAQAPVRQCVANILALAQFEHRGRTCSHTILSDAGSSTKINYSCGPADFGQSEVDVLTPRSLRISTQGISDKLPFNYVLQARRVGDCTKSISSSRH